MNDSITSSLPTSLDKWRRCALGKEMHEAWVPLSPWLSEHGITLFPFGTIYCVPPDGVKRGKEPGMYRIVEGEDWNGDHGVQQRSALIHPARDASGRWVLLRAVRLWEDGTCHRDILRFLSSYPQRADSRNHALPVLTELEAPELTVAVFPLMSLSGIELPWFFSFGEVLELVMQTAEALAFLHEHRIAHRDISQENIVLNLSGSRSVNGTRFSQSPWRSKFPIRYFFIDFEYAIQFDARKDFSTCLVNDPPCKFYDRASAPEVFGSTPYDPFAADVFALGLMFWRLFQQVTHKTFSTLVEAMLSPEPSKRPTASEALCSFHAYREGLTAAVLDTQVPDQLTTNWDTTHPNAVQPQHPH